MASQTDQAVKAAHRFVRAVQRSGVDLDAAYLYGSYANGTPHADSDIDVALVSKDLTGGIEDLEKIAAATRDIHSRVENVRFHPRDFREENPLVWEIKTTGIPLIRANLAQIHPVNPRQVIAYWRKMARQEWRAAASFLATKQYSYALEFGRRYLEALLKAVVVGRTGRHAPYRLGLIELADAAQLELTPRQWELLQRAENYTSENFEQPDATAVRQSHTQRFTSGELKAIQKLGQTLLAQRSTVKD